MTTRPPLRTLALGLGTAALVALAAWSLLGLLQGAFSPPGRLELRGLRLGYTPSMTRSAFEGGVDGTFRTATVGEDLHLEWTPADDRGPVRWARMEFHAGLLVAVRLDLAPDAPEAAGPAIEDRPDGVLERRSADGAVRLRYLALHCPTHADEVARIRALTRTP
ncbi:MAG: hypothetical protein ACFCGT_20910 [Sandaracinaceae bacterium]